MVQSGYSPTMTSPFRIHAILVRPDGSGDALDEDGNYLFTLDPDGVSQIQEVLPGIAVLRAATEPPEICPHTEVFVNAGANWICDQRVVGMDPTGHAAEVGAGDPDLSVLGICTMPGSGLVPVVTQPGATVNVDLEFGIEHMASPGNPLYLSDAEDGKVTPVRPQTSGVAVVQIGVAVGPVCTAGPNGCGYISLVLIPARKPQVTIL